MTEPDAAGLIRPQAGRWGGSSGEAGGGVPAWAREAGGVLSRVFQRVIGQVLEDLAKPSPG